MKKDEEFSKFELANEILDSHGVPIEHILLVSQLYIDQALEIFKNRLLEKLKEEINKKEPNEDEKKD